MSHRLRLFALAALLACTSFVVAAQEQSKSSPDQPAQQASSPESQAGAAQKSDPNLSKDIAQNERQLAKESREVAGEGDETAEFKESPSVQSVAKHLGISVGAAYWILVVLNFAIIAALIVWFWRSKMPTAFRTRTESILKSMEIAKQASEDASRRLKDVEGRLSRIDTEIAQMKSAAEAAAHDEELRIRAAAEEDKKRIIEAAEQEIDAAARSARTQLKTFAAELAIGLAEKQIRIDPNTDQSLVRGFGQQLAQSARNGKETS